MFAGGLSSVYMYVIIKCTIIKRYRYGLIGIEKQENIGS